MQVHDYAFRTLLCRFFRIQFQHISYQAYRHSDSSIRMYQQANEVLCRHLNNAYSNGQLCKYRNPQQKDDIRSRFRCPWLTFEKHHNNTYKRLLMYAKIKLSQIWHK